MYRERKLNIRKHKLTTYSEAYVAIRMRDEIRLAIQKYIWLVIFYVLERFVNQSSIKNAHQEPFI